jgi:hypothetical protein
MKIFSGKRYFNDILWAPANNNNTLPPSIPSFLVTKIVYNGYGQLKK